MDDYTQANRAVWNAWTEHHRDSDHHLDVERFQTSGSSLRAIERAELGDVAGKTLLHLQCNMGCDTLSWARLGAAVTGVDLADAAIERARALALEAGLAGRFIRSDLYELPNALDERFDIVFASYGALCWMPDLARWAEIVARYVKPGGEFYIVDMHPFGMLFESQHAHATDTTFQVVAPYFHGAQPVAERAQHTGGAAGMVYAWHYGLGEVISALVDAGLHITFVHEFPMAHYQQFPVLVPREDGLWHWPEGSGNTMPLLFSILARNDGAR